MLGKTRAYSRMTLVLGWTVFMFVLRVCAMPIALASRAAERRLRQWLFSEYARGVLAITGIDVQVSGRAPDPPFYMVSNHLTFFDVLVLASRLGCVFVSRADLAEWPVLGFITRHMQTVYIDRDKLKDTVRVNEQIRDRMNKGYGVVVFAESKCSEEGTVMPFKPALLQSAVELGLPVHYASIHYATPDGQPPASEAVIWKGETGFVEHYVDVASLSQVQATITFGEEPITRSCRKTLAIDLHAAVSAVFAPIK
mgnify:CR=1 FL=1